MGFFGLFFVVGVVGVFLIFGGVVIFMKDLKLWVFGILSVSLVFGGVGSGCWRRVFCSLGVVIGCKFGVGFDLGVLGGVFSKLFEGSFFVVLVLGLRNFILRVGDDLC